MPVSVLMIAQDPGLSAALRQTLEDNGEYHLRVVPTGVQGLEIASAREFDLAIVDMNLRGEYARNVIRGLRADHPRLAVLAISINDDPGSPALKGLDLQGVLTRPFVPSDLVERIEKALGRPVPRHPPAPPTSLRYGDYSASEASVSSGQVPASHPLEGSQRPALIHSPPGPEIPQAPQSMLAGQPVPPWLEDVNKAAQYLARLSLETSAYAALLIRGPQLRAYAGQFGQAQAGELARLAHENWSRHGGRGALVRFVRLSPAEDDYILYSTSVAGDMVLSMVFHAEAPIGMIRKQARQLVEALTRTPGPHPVPRSASLWGPHLPRTDMLGWPPVGKFADRGGEGPQLDGTLDPDTGLENPQSLAGSYSSRNKSGLHHLHYTFILVPKFARYRLEGELSARLQELLRHYPVAFHWRLDRLAIKPGHLVLNLTCPPTIAPDQVARRLKELTSERLFLEFPRLAQDDPSGDFWAPGYLLVGTGEVPAPQQVMDYLAHVRQEQGLAK